MHALEFSHMSSAPHVSRKGVTELGARMLPNCCSVCRCDAKNRELERIAMVSSSEIELEGHMHSQS